MGSLHADSMTDAGIVVESPPGQSAGISPIRREHTDALAEAVSEVLVYRFDDGVAGR